MSTLSRDAMLQPGAYVTHDEAQDVRLALFRVVSREDNGTLPGGQKVWLEPAIEHAMKGYRHRWVSVAELRQDFTLVRSAEQAHPESVRTDGGFLAARPERVLLVPVP